MPSRHRHIFWDMGGTLVDTYPELNEALTDAAERRGAAILIDDVAALTRTSTQHAIDTLAARTGLPAGVFEQANADLKRRWESNPPPVMTGARELMADVRAAGGLNLVITHRDRTSAEALVAALALRVEDMVCAPDGFPRKPDPTMVQLLLGRHGLDVDDCIFVGDRPIDAEAAHAAGMASALLHEEPSHPAHHWHRIETLDDLRPLLHLEPA